MENLLKSTQYSGVPIDVRIEQAKLNRENKLRDLLSSFPKYELRHSTPRAPITRRLDHGRRILRHKQNHLDVIASEIKSANIQHPPNKMRIPTRFTTETDQYNSSPTLASSVRKFASRRRIVPIHNSVRIMHVSTSRVGIILIA